jgi:LuxR family transcriptional regulator, quorum-sensing system regulator CciR
LTNVFRVNRSDAPGQLHRPGSLALLHPRDSSVLLLEFIEASAEAHNCSELIQLYQRTVLQLDYEYFACTQLDDERVWAHSPPREPPVLALAYPGNWIQHYLTSGYFAVDPVVHRARLTAAPYHWGEMGGLNRQEQRILAEAEDAGLRRGLSVPVHEPNGRVFLVSLATEHSRARSARESVLLQMLAVQLHARYHELRRAAHGDS